MVCNVFAWVFTGMRFVWWLFWLCDSSVFFASNKGVVLKSLWYFKIRFGYFKVICWKLLFLWWKWSVEKNGYVDVLHKMVYIYFIKKMCKFKICLVKNGVHLFLGRSSTGIRTVYGSHLPNLLCIWFIECFFRWGTLVDVLWVRVFYIFFVWVFMNILSVSTFIGGKFHIVFF